MAAISGSQQRTMFGGGQPAATGSRDAAAARNRSATVLPSALATSSSSPKFVVRSPSNRPYAFDSSYSPVRDKNAHLEKCHDAAVTRTEEDEALLHTLYYQLDGFRDELLVKNEMARSLASALVSEQRTTQCIRHDNDALSEQISSLTHQLNELKESIREQSPREDALRERIDELQDTLDDADSRLAAPLRSEILQLKQTKLDLENQMTEWKGKMKEALREAKKREQQLTSSEITLQTEITSLQERLKQATFQLQASNALTSRQRATKDVQTDLSCPVTSGQASLNFDALTNPLGAGSAAGGVGNALPSTSSSLPNDNSFGPHSALVGSPQLDGSFHVFRRRQSLILHSQQQGGAERSRERGGSLTLLSPGATTTIGGIAADGSAVASPPALPLKAAAGDAASPREWRDTHASGAYPLPRFVAQPGPIGSGGSDSQHRGLASLASPTTATDACDEMAGGAVGASAPPLELPPFVVTVHLTAANGWSIDSKHRVTHGLTVAALIEQCCQQFRSRHQQDVSADRMCLRINHDRAKRSVILSPHRELHSFLCFHRLQKEGKPVVLFLAPRDEMQEFVQLKLQQRTREALSDA